MNWLTYLFRSKTMLTLGLNCLLIAGFLALRTLLPNAALRPTLSLPQTTQLSVANWLAARLADVASLIEALLHHLLK